MSNLNGRNSPELLEQLYLGAVEEEELRPFLSQLAQSYDASLATLATMDGASRHDSLRLTRWADQRDYDGIVPEYYAVRSPFRPIMMLESNIGHVLTSSDMISPERRKRDVFINEFLRPTDHEFLATGIFARSNDQHTYFVLNRGRGPGEFDRDAVDGLQALMPHLRTMLRIRNNMVARDRQIDFTHTMADRSGDGLVLLDRHGKVHSMNARAEEILTSADGLAVKDSKLLAASGEDNAHLGVAIETLLQDGASQAPQPGLSLAVRRPSGAQPYRLHVMPLAVRKFVFAGDTIELAIQIVDRQASAKQNNDKMVEQFGLSPAEIRVALHLVDGVSLKQIADRLGNSINTIKVHRKNLYRKLGVNRHFDFVRMFGASS